MFLWVSNNLFYICPEFSCLVLNYRSSHTASFLMIFSNVWVITRLLLLLSNATDVITMITCMLYSNCGLKIHLYAPIHNLNSLSLTLFTIFLLIVLTVELACFPASTHCLEGFALLYIITFKCISY